MRVLIVGSGGREHALAWKIARSTRVRQIISCPGNAGLENLGDTWPDLAPERDHDALIERVRQQHIDLVVIGPEAPLVAGLADRLRGAGIPTFGPSASASRLEGSKGFAKEFLARHRIPTARHVLVHGESRLVEALEQFPGPVVVKADGLAAGKGVTVCDHRAQAEAVARDMLRGTSFGSAGSTVVLEERLEGIEQTLLVLVSKTTYRLLEPARDYKALEESDRGPNTGGMGAYSPTDLLTPALRERVIREILEPTLTGLQAEGVDYKGVLYLGLMLTRTGPQVLEFNVRFGDPETQPLMLRLRTDLVTLFEALESGRLAEQTLEWDPRPAVCVVMAAGEYPATARTGLPIEGPIHCPLEDDTQVFHAATRRVGGRVVTAGGRVLGVTALGTDLAQARARAYERIGQIRFEGNRYRQDIAAV